LTGSARLLLTHLSGMPARFAGNDLAKNPAVA
jgi:hypothetical protein